MISYTLVDGALVLPKQSPIRFPQAIEEVAVFDDVLVVRLALSTENLRNVYAVDAHGKTIWQIEEPPLNPNRDVYMGIGRMSDHVVRAGSSMGVSLDIDVHTGKVLTSILTK